MQETYTPNDATEEIAVQEEEEIPQDQDSRGVLGRGPGFREMKKAYFYS
mgnify:CR=1 FL=1